MIAASTIGTASILPTSLNQALTSANLPVRDKIQQLRPKTIMLACESNSNLEIRVIIRSRANSPVPMAPIIVSSGARMLSPGARMLLLVLTVTSSGPAIALASPPHVAKLAIAANIRSQRLGFGVGYASR